MDGEHTASITYRPSGAAQTTFSPANTAAKIYVLVLIEVVFVGLWCASFVCMLLPKGKDFKKLFVRPQYEMWDVGVAMAICEM